jgi:3-oxoacyl-[acyl-carrier-protein] synthase III
MLNEVYITRLAKFLPNRPIHNEDMEKFLGMVDGMPSRAQGIILRNNQIKERYYALDEQGRQTHTNAQLTAGAIRMLFGDGISQEEMDLLACGTTSPDQILPSHASMVHGELGGHPLEILSQSGSCATGMHAMKFAYLAVKSGERKHAVCTGSELFSTFMLARNFEKEAEHLHLIDENPILAFEKDFLRWMLSDGAGAALLTDKPNPNGHSLRIEWIETISYANQLETCMYSGGEKQPDWKFKGWREFEAQDLLDRSVFSLRQDVKLLGDNIVKMGGVFMKDIFDRRNISVDDFQYFLPHLSSEYFRVHISGELDRMGMHIPQEKWFTNLTRLGNVGAASIYFMLEELFHSGKLKKGDRILCMIPESARFSYVYSLITVV